MYQMYVQNEWNPEELCFTAFGNAERLKHSGKRKAVELQSRRLLQKILLYLKLFLLGLHPEKHYYSWNVQTSACFMPRNVLQCCGQSFIDQILLNGSDIYYQALQQRGYTYILKAKQHVLEDIWSLFIYYITGLGFNRRKWMINLHAQCRFQSCRNYIVLLHMCFNLH